MEVAKLSALPNLKVRFVSFNESAIKRWLSSELEETVFSLTHELFNTKHHTATVRNYYRVANCPRDPFFPFQNLLFTVSHFFNSVSDRHLQKLPVYYN